MWSELATRSTLFRARVQVEVMNARNYTKSKKPQRTATSAKKKKRILMVHGYGQTAESFRKKTGAFRKSVKSTVGEFVFIEATLDAPPREKEEKEAGDPDIPTIIVTHYGHSSTLDAALEEERGELSLTTKGIDANDGKAWWVKSKSDTTGWKESMNYLVSTLERERFDGIVGFSQGASMVSLLVAENQRRGTDWFQFAVFISGFLPRAPEMKEMATQSKTQIPTWHCFGETDAIIPQHMSQELSALMGDKAVTCSHSGGHFVPSSKETRDSMKKFMASLD